MGEQFGFVIPARHGQKFHIADVCGLIGEPFPVYSFGRSVDATVVDAWVREDRRAIVLTVETDECLCPAHHSSEHVWAPDRIKTGTPDE